MSKRKPPLDEKALAFFRRTGRIGGKRSMETMTAVERSERARRARLAGGGRKPVVDGEKVLALRAEGRTLKETAKAARCSVPTVVRILRQARDARLGRKGGQATARNLTQKQRSEAARKAATTRWAKAKGV
jgi:hypothetical protein